ncbi:putative ATPase [Tritonibacter multivorans]|uniref:Putative ATPase n=1 Tax=Tritonibacter multivorans TaxID=928856 RepID=A0A0P1GPJ8_9RHOB|nr:hypothetical protein [Tritonibacter multivorans]MDA7422333.1 hypothetical protein [Tritonibacter multivorans]CUH77718.1 putative ATPase [Tritonibacter multivorans]SFD13440.1 hypothetical protein SAMN04488049_107129 [Tritonibacter multivorans]
MTADDPKAQKDLGLALRTLAWQAKWRGEMEDARILCEQAIEPLAASGARNALADVYSVLAIVHLSQFRFAASDQAVSRAFALLNGNGPFDSHVDLLTTKASLLSNLGKIDEAGECLAQAKEIAKGIEQARLCQNLSRYQLVRGDLREVRVQAASGLVLARACNNRVVLPYLHELLGAALIRQGQHRLARGVLEDGLQLALEDQDKRVECHLLSLLGQIDCNEGDEAHGLTRLERAALVARDMNYPAATSGIRQVLDKMPDPQAKTSEHMRKTRIETILNKTRLS